MVKCVMGRGGRMISRSMSVCLCHICVSRTCCFSVGGLSAGRLPVATPSGHGRRQGRPFWSVGLRIIFGLFRRKEWLSFTSNNSSYPSCFRAGKSLSLSYNNECDSWWRSASRPQRASMSRIITEEQLFPTAATQKPPSYFDLCFDRQRCRKHTDRGGSHETVIFPRSVHNYSGPEGPNTTSQKKATTYRNVSPCVLRKSCVFSNVVFYEMPLRFLSSRRDARGRRTQPSIFCLSVSFLATLQENSKKASRFRDWGWFIHTHISADCTGRFCWFHFLRKWNCDIGTVRTSSDSAALAFSLSISQSLTWGRFPSVFLSFSLPLRLSLYSITCMHDLHRYSPLLTIYTFLL